MGREDEILKAGREILLSEGLRAITTNEIARRARMSKKTLYALFPNKDALVEAVVVSFLEGNLAKWDEILDGGGTAIDRILSSLDFVSHFLPQIQSSVIKQAERIAPALWRRIDAIRLKRLARLRGLWEESQQDGYLRDDVPADLWILLLTATVRSVLIPSVLLEERIPLPALIDTIKKIYYEGLLTERGRRYVGARQPEEER